MRWHTTDYRKRDKREARGTLINRGFWLTLPRLMLLCRVFGHKAVVDGYDNAHDGGSRWVACDRCGVRPDTQGRLDPKLWQRGQRYNGERAATPLDRSALKTLKLGGKVPPEPPFYLPGPWPPATTGVIGGQLIIGKTHGLFNVGVELGHAGADHVLAGHIQINPLGALYLHTEGFGTWWQRRLNSVGYDSREIGLSAHDGSVYWKLWAKDGSWSNTDPKWWLGSFRYDLRDIVFGDLKYSYEDVAGPVTAVVRMPHGDDHVVVLRLRRETRARKRGRPKEQGWSVNWNCDDGIPTKGLYRGRVCGSAVKVTDEAVENRSWPFAATAAIAARLTSDRVRHGYRHPVIVPVDVDDPEPAMEL
jgi:hypothetical protein